MREAAGVRLLVAGALLVALGCGGTKDGTGPTRPPGRCK